MINLLTPSTVGAHRVVKLSGEVDIACAAELRDNLLGLVNRGVPSLVVDLSAAVLTTAYLNFGHDRDFVFCVDTSFRVEGTDSLRGHFLLLPDMPSLRAIFDAIRLP